MIVVTTESNFHVDPIKLAKALADDPKGFADLMAHFCHLVGPNPPKTADNPLGQPRYELKPYLDAVEALSAGYDVVTLFNPLQKLIDGLRYRASFGKA